ncbi:MAG: Flp family type IVb pilin [Caenibius sp.]
MNVGKFSRTAPCGNYLLGISRAKADLSEPYWREKLVSYTKILLRLLGDNAGASAVEYGLILSLIALTIMAALQSVAGSTIAMWARVEAAVNAVMGG